MARLRKNLKRLMTQFRGKLPPIGWRDRCSRIPSQTKACELQLLHEQFTLAFETGIAVEIGSYMGAASVALADVVRRKQRGNVYCVDTWQNHAMSEGQLDTYAEFQRHTRPYEAWINPIRSISFEANIPIEPGTADLVFIDGDHSYEGCRADVDRFAPLLREGGTIVMHDHRWYSTVTKVVGEMLQTETWIVRKVDRNIISLTKDTNHQGRHEPKTSFVVRAA